MRNGISRPTSTPVAVTQPYSTTRKASTSENAKKSTGEERPPTTPTRISTSMNRTSRSRRTWRDRYDPTPIENR